MSKPITKEMWAEIEAEMAGGWVDIAFNYKGYEVSVQRVRESESKTCLQVYVDGHIKGAWVSFKDGISFTEDAPSILSEVWCLKTKAKYPTKFKKQIEKIYGKRRAKKRVPRIARYSCFSCP